MVSPEKVNSGMVQVYTGDGKGKTTAALGLALRAIGHGFKIYMVQFMKGDPGYGELKAIGNLPNFVVRQFGRPDFVDRKNPAEIDLRLAREGLAHAGRILSGGEYDMVILDEINVALHFKLIDLQDVLALIKNRPAETELVLTGRYAPQEILEAADLVTEMREVKHYFRQGRGSRDGIEH
ncbi:cob(I)yrinic acid a,c-diamide adenosyltransferase [bacterium]|nr:cob(I)yrinic acid a,c-diamide adenosyltransferase [bacterium]